MLSLTDFVAITAIRMMEHRVQEYADMDHIPVAEAAGAKRRVLKLFDY